VGLWAGLRLLLLDRVTLTAMPSSAALRVLSRRLLRLAGRVGAGVLVLLLVVYCGLRVSSVYLAHRSVALLAEAAQIQIGASEGSVLPIVARYGGVKEMPPPPVSAEDCLVPSFCETPKAPNYDYWYEVDLSPFDLFSRNLPKGRLGRALEYLMYWTSSSWRDPLSLRNSMVDVSIDIRAGRVEVVHGGLYVEGRNGWLGNIWDVAQDMSRHDMGSKAYVIGGAFLSFPPSGGAGTTHSLTAGATAEQFEAAQSFNSECLTAFFPCRGLHDLSPRAYEYLCEHPDMGSISTEGCPSSVRPGK